MTVNVEISDIKRRRNGRNDCAAIS